MKATLGSATLQCRHGNRLYLIAMRDPPVFLSPCGCLGVPEEIRTGAMSNSDLGATQAEEVFLSHVSARAIEAVCLRKFDSFDLETLM